MKTCKLVTKTKLEFTVAITTKMNKTSSHQKCNITGRKVKVIFGYFNDKKNYLKNVLDFIDGGKLDNLVRQQVKYVFVNPDGMPSCITSHI